MNETRVAYFRGRCPLLSPAAHGLVAFAWLLASRMSGLRRSPDGDWASGRPSAGLKCRFQPRGRSPDGDWALTLTIPRGIRREVGTERHFSAAQDNFPRMQ